MRVYAPARGLRRVPSQLWWIAAMLFAGLLVFFLAAAGLGRYLGALVLVAIPAIVLWRRPFWGLVALVTLGIAHSFLMMLLLHITGSTTILRMAQLWKELVLAVLLVRGVYRAFQRHQAPRLYWIDLAIVAFVAIGALYLIYPGSFPEHSLFARAMGLRADASFLVAYFIGRLLGLTKGQVRTLLIALGLTTLVVGVVAVLQFAAPDLANQWFNQLGFQEFMLAQRGDFAIQESVRTRALSGFDLPRASSILLSDLVLAFFSLMAAPLALGVYMTAKGSASRALSYGFFLISISLTFLTVTRSAIVALIPALLLVVALSRKPWLAAFLAVQAVLAALVIAGLTGLTPRTLRGIFSPDEASVRAHIAAIEESFEIARVEPLGRGLGTAGQVAQRLKPPGAITNESWYLQIATEIGIIPAVLYIAVLAGFGGMALLRYRRFREPLLRGLCLGMGGAAVALGLVGLTLHAWEGLTVSIIFWLFAGIVVQVESLVPPEGASLDADRGLA